MTHENEIVTLGVDTSILHHPQPQMRRMHNPMSYQFNAPCSRGSGCLVYCGVYTCGYHRTKPEWVRPQGKFIV